MLLLLCSNLFWSVVMTVRLVAGRSNGGRDSSLAVGVTRLSSPKSMDSFPDVRGPNRLALRGSNRPVAPPDKTDGASLTVIAPVR